MKSTELVEAERQLIAEVAKSLSIDPAELTEETPLASIGIDSMSLVRLFIFIESAFNVNLIKEGFAPYCPLLGHFQQMVHPQDYETWMMLDIEWLSACSALLRLPGLSYGAEQEVEYARNNEIPVFYTIEQLKEYYHDID